MIEHGGYHLQRIVVAPNPESNPACSRPMLEFECPNGCTRANSNLFGHVLIEANEFHGVLRIYLPIHVRHTEPSVTTGLSRWRPFFCNSHRWSLKCNGPAIGPPTLLHAQSSFRQSYDRTECRRRSRCGTGHRPIVQSRRVSNLSNRCGGVPFSLFDNLSRSHIHRILPASFAFVISSTKGFAYSAVNRQVHNLVAEVDSNSEPCLSHEPTVGPHPLKSEGGGVASSFS